MCQLLRTNSTNPEFITLVSLLDADLAQRDGKDHSFYAQFNGITHLNHVIVLYQNNTPVACGAIKEYNDTTVEVKRMFVQPEHRGKGYASKVLVALENWSKELGHKSTILETGLRQPEAIALYKKNGYEIIDNYPPYVGIENSVCFKKDL
ncbi:GNAT family N-acetyltransferase [Maribacter sp. LLG6340-A2]|uniref:GNAT family N-acetyltransferase n=1 Tax=Maribacter sp. LLG6340-A2 TaxID=3160834 RepID=UPI00386F59B6